MAQLVARYLGVVEAVGSSPVTQTSTYVFFHPFTKGEHIHRSLKAVRFSGLLFCYDALAVFQLLPFFNIS